MTRDECFAVIDAARQAGARPNLRDADLCDADLCDACLCGTAIMVIGGGKYYGCVTPTHLHVGCVRLALADIPADDDRAAWDAIHEHAWAWWQQYGPVVRAAIIATEPERQAILAREDA